MRRALPLFLLACAETQAPTPNTALQTAPSADPTVRVVHDGPISEKPTGVPIGEPPTAGTMFHASFGEAIDVGLLPAPEDGEPLTRLRQRVDIDQLDALIRGVTLGFGWEVAGKDQLVELAATLGKPDYIDQTNEDLDASALFMKFLGDAARSVCDETRKRDLAAGPDDERALMRMSGPKDTWQSAPELIDANLQALLLRFHGKAVSTDDVELEHWRWLYRTAELKLDPPGAWQAVCVGLMTHPDFYSY